MATTNDLSDFVYGDDNPPPEPTPQSGSGATVASTLGAAANMPWPNQWDQSGQWARPPMDPVDRDTLVKTVAGEAGSEGLAGQAAVAHVLFNRLNAGGYGDSIADIAKAPAPGAPPALGYHEFSMWNPPGKGGNAAATLDPKSPAYNAVANIVDQVYRGMIPDPTGGATHYYAPASMPGGQPPRQWPQAWLQAQPKVKIGNQIFIGGAGGPGQKPPSQIAGGNPDIGVWGS